MTKLLAEEGRDLLFRKARGYNGDTGEPVGAAFFAGTPIRSNFPATLRHGDPATIFERLPRLSFEEATRIA